jgi:hypothetical protein
VASVQTWVERDSKASLSGVFQYTVTKTPHQMNHSETRNEIECHSGEFHCSVSYANCSIQYCYSVEIKCTC